MKMLHHKGAISRGDRPSPLGAARAAFRARRLTACLALLIAALAAPSCRKSDARSAVAPAQVPASAEDPLVVYAADSFASEWGPGPQVSAAFTKATGIPVSILGKGDTGQIISDIISEGASPRADIILGIDQQLLPLAAEAGILSAYRPAGLESVRKELCFDPKDRVIPYDYGFFSLIWDSESGTRPPESLDELLLPEYRKSIILMDPRTSSPGLGFLSWTLSAEKGGWKEYWKALMPNVLTIAPGWDSGYGLFLKGEAPLVLSYTTSPAYHLEYEGSSRYKALVFSCGHAFQIEGGAILAAAKHRNEAEAFMDFMLSPGFQEIIPLTNWMFPVLDGLKLPASYSIVPEVEMVEAPSAEDLSQALDEWPEAAR